MERPSGLVKRGLNGNDDQTRRRLERQAAVVRAGG